MSTLTERIYLASPVWTQKLGVHAFGWYWRHRRLGPAFEKHQRKYIERESWSSDRFQNYVEESLRHQLLHPFQNVAYYHHKFREYGLSEQDIVKFPMDDLPRFPLLEKPFVRANPELLLTRYAAEHPPKCFQTSGTTGTPLRLYWDSECHQHNIAARAARSFRWAGVGYRESRAVVAGRVILDPKRNLLPFWRFNVWEKQLYLSSFHILPQNMPDYVAALDKYRPVTLTGFTSALSFLAKTIEDAGLRPPKPRAIITYSEALRPKMRTVIERVFDAKAYEEYGAMENCVLATECEHGRMHVYPNFGFVDCSGQTERPRVRGKRAKSSGPDSRTRGRSLSGIESVIWRNGLRSFVPVGGRCFRCWKQWLAGKKTFCCFPTGEASCGVSSCSRTYPTWRNRKLSRSR